ncbi:MAG: hypothetical protein JO019_04775 [Candidatus Kaiserbacteria bacterium]|nr:hypothetical protein [Candidatus Kaiserbacteria bacterium]
MDDELRRRLETLEQKVDATYKAAEKVRKYLFWTGVVTIALIVLPAVGLVFVIPSFVAQYGNIDNLDMNSLTQ